MEREERWEWEGEKVLEGGREDERRLEGCWREGGEKGGWRECRGGSEVEGERGERNKERERGRIATHLKLLKVIVLVLVLCVCRSAPADPLTPFRR